jgi:uncharacterized protein with PIN domain
MGYNGYFTTRFILFIIRLWHVTDFTLYRFLHGALMKRFALFMLISMFYGQAEQTININIDGMQVESEFLYTECVNCHKQINTEDTYNIVFCSYYSEDVFYLCEDCGKEYYKNFVITNELNELA